jgi:hypothetical protein
MIGYHTIAADSDICAFLKDLHSEVERELDAEITVDGTRTEVGSGYVEEWQWQDADGNHEIQIQLFQSDTQWEILVYFHMDLQAMILQATEAAREKKQKKQKRDSRVDYIEWN